MADDSIKFKLDLDDKGAREKLESFKSSLDGLKGSSASIEGLLNAFIKYGPALAVAAAAVYALKKAFDFTLEGEQILKVQNQFDALAKDAGVNGEKIKEGLEKATKGTVDMTDAMKSANKAIIELGPSANKIPELFDLARRSGKVFGGETTDNFEKLSQAIASGNTRILRTMGIFVDAEKAVKDYAKANNYTVDTLNAFGKQQAIMNAVLAQGNQKFKDSKDGQESLSTSIKQFVVVMKDFGDSVAIAFNKALGPTLQSSLKKTTEWFKETATSLKKTFGEGTEDLAYQMEQAKKAITVFEEARDKVKDKGGFLNKIFGESEEKLNARVEKAKAHLDELQKKYDAAMANEKAAKPQAEEKEGPSGQDALKATEKQLDLEKQLMSIKAENANLTRATTTDEVMFKEAANQQELLLRQSYALQLQKLDSDVDQSKKSTDLNYIETRGALEEQLQLKLRELQQQTANQQDVIYENQLKQSKSIGDAFIASANIQGSTSNQMQRLGEKSFNALKGSSVAAFKAMGDGSQSASEAFKKYMLGALGEMAIAEGTAYVAKGIAMMASYQPSGAVVTAQGGALIALGAALGAAGGSGGSEGGSGGGGGGGGVASYSSAPSTAAPEAAEAAKHKGVNITVQGSYFETAETQRRLVDLLKQENDATDYKFTNIGVR